MSSPSDPRPLESPQDSSKDSPEPPAVPSDPAAASAETSPLAQDSGSQDQPPSRPRRRILIGSQRDPAAYRVVRPRRDWIRIRHEGSKKTGQQPAAAPPQGAQSAGRPAGSPPAAREGSGSSASTTVLPPAPPPPAAPPPAPSVAEPQTMPAAPPEPCVSAPPETPVADESRPIAGSQGPSALDTPQSVGPAPAPTPTLETSPKADIVAQGLPAAAPEVSSAMPETVAPFVEGGQVRPAEAAGLELPSRPLEGLPESRRAERPAAPQGAEEKEPSGRGRRGRREGPRTERVRDLGPAVTRTVEPPSVRQKLSPELEAEFAEAVGDVPLEEMMTAAAPAARPALEPESRHTATVIAVRRDDVFVELGSREQGILPLKSFAEPPQVGQSFEVVVLRFNNEDGLYELALPGAAAEVGDWSSLAEGMLVEARITGYNAGGLECEVNRLRGFIPVSQVALYRVENLAEFVEQKLACLVVEVNPQRRRLVLSRRAVLEREKAEARQKLLDSLAPGQVHDGVVRKLMDFGAFVDLGGVDGLLHISQLSWGRVKHPSEVLEEGQRVRVRIDKIDRETGKISLGYKDLLEDPWIAADRKYLPNTRAHGRVVKIMEFGAFVELEPGVEGLIHISELSHKRVARVSDVLKEGEEVDVMVLAVDVQSRRISLSLKNLTPPPEPEKAEKAPPSPATPAEPPPPPAKPKKPAVPLRGGLGRSPGGGLFGLKW